MKKRSWRQLKKHMALAISTIAMCGVVCAQDKNPPPASSSQLSVTGRVIATELSPEVKQIIDAARKLYETPGLILDRMAIYGTIDAQPHEILLHKTTEGTRSMYETLIPERKYENPNWQIGLYYQESIAADTWSVRVRFDISRDGKCYSSGLVEEYWGQRFTYRPSGTHALLHELSRPRDTLPTGPHDGVPYYAEFHGLHKNSANIIFNLGVGGCLLAISASNLFNSKEYSNDRIYHE